MADGDHQLTNAQPVRAAQHHRPGVDGGPGPYHGQVGQRIGARHVHLGLRAVGELDDAVLGVADDVRVGQQVPVVGEQHGRPRPARPA